MHHTADEYDGDYNFTPIVLVDTVMTARSGLRDLRLVAGLMPEMMMPRQPSYTSFYKARHWHCGWMWRRLNKGITKLPRR